MLLSSVAVAVAAVYAHGARVEGMTTAKAKVVKGCENLWGGLGADAPVVPGGITRQDVRSTYHYYAPNYETSSLACADRFWADPDHGRKLMKFGWHANCLDGKAFSQSTCGKCFRITNRRTGASVVSRAVDFGGCSDKDGTGLDLDPCVFNAIDTDGQGVADGNMRVDVVEVECGADATIGTVGPTEKLVKTKTKKKKKKKAEGSTNAEGWAWSSADLPPPSDADTWCKTWMSDENDTGECFALAYHHCVDGRKDESKIPDAIKNAKKSAMGQIYDVQKTCTHDNNGAVDKYKCFETPPKTWTSVCAARPELAGKGKCKKVSKNEWRTWVKGDDPQRKSECQFSSLYLKSHFIGDTIQGQFTGKHGRG